MNGIYANFRDWTIVKYSTLIVGLIFGLIILTHGINELSMRIAIRATARTSCILFIAAFVASSLRHFNSSKFAKWLRANRRYFGISMAISHVFHAIAIIGLAILAYDPDLANDHGGNLGYFFIITMAFTSFKTTATFLGERGWKILHTVGMYYLWLAFIYIFGSRITECIPIYLPFILLLAVAMLLRLATIFNYKFKFNK